jgi:hypothetical protein
VHEDLKRRFHDVWNTVTLLGVHNQRGNEVRRQPCHWTGNKKAPAPLETHFLRLLFNYRFTVARRQGAETGSSRAHCPSLNERWVNIKQWWNDTDSRRQDDSEGKKRKKLPQCHFVHLKSHTDWPGRESPPAVRSRWQTTWAITQLTHYFTARSLWDQNGSGPVTKTHSTERKYFRFPDISYSLFSRLAPHNDWDITFRQTTANRLVISTSFITLTRPQMQRHLHNSCSKVGHENKTTPLLFGWLTGWKTAWLNECPTDWLADPWTAGLLAG